VLTGVFMINLHEREEHILGYWQKEKPIQKLKQINADKKKFYFLDGPPYVSGPLGSHHAWVAAVKDVVLRHKRYLGYYVHDRAGFDVHGLPTEHKVEVRLDLKTKSDIESVIGIEKFIQECKNFTDEQLENAIKTYRRFGSSLDFDDFYLPYRTNYMNKGWNILKEIYKKGLLYKDLKSLAYCPHCETVFSSQGPEIEYNNDQDPSLYIRFKVNTKKKSKLKFDDNTYFIIWTTTPWTIPANMAIAANPEVIYVLAKVNENRYIIAKERLDDFASAIGESAVVNSEFYGTELAGTYYTHPLEERIPVQKMFNKYHKILLSKTLVSAAEGTGLVHIAPGHGLDDYNLGKQNHLPIFTPIDQHARYTADAGEYNSLRVPSEANKAVLADLKKSGALLFEGRVTHSYPHCWRCGEKLIYKATEQWFINVQKIKKSTIKANSKIKWHPETAKLWQQEVLESSPDWCISRQRYWGLPIPIWVCRSCNEMEVIGSAEELAQRANLKEPLPDLHRPYVDRVTFKCGKCTGAMHRIEDIFDVWYDSGIAHTASLSEEEFSKLFPADWITESRDQLRAWFSMLLRTSAALYGSLPFKEVLIGGILLDEFGRPMHRHLGNAVDANDLLKMASADGFRLWCLGKPRWYDLYLKKDELKRCDTNIITLYNVAELVKEFAALSNTDAKKISKPNTSKLPLEDQWIISRANSLIKRVSEGLEGYMIHDAVNEMKDFLVDDLSRFYLKFAKKRAELASRQELKSIAKTTLYVLHNTLVLLSVAAPFSCEYIYQEVFAKEKESIFSNKWPRSKPSYINNNLEKDFEIMKEAITAILNLREKENLKLRQPLSGATIETSYDDAAGTMERLEGLIASYTNLKSLKIVKVATPEKEIRPIYQKIGPAFKSSAGAVAEELAKQDPEKLQKELTQKGEYLLHTSSGMFTILPEHFVIIEKPLAVERKLQFKYGVVSLNTEITNELKEEFIVRAVVRQIQLMRREEGLTKRDLIQIYIDVLPEMKEIISKNELFIRNVAKAKKLTFGPQEGMKERELLDGTFRLAVRKS